MDTRFPPILPQCQIDPRPLVRALALPSLPYGEWLLAGIALLALLPL